MEFFETGHFKNKEDKNRMDGCVVIGLKDLHPGDIYVKAGC